MTAALSPALCERDALLAELGEIEQLRRHADGRMQVVLAKLSRSACPDELTPRSVDRHYVREEVAGVVRVSPDAARMRLHNAAEAEEHFPELTMLMWHGETTLAHWLCFTDAARALEPAHKRLLLGRLFEKARCQPITSFRASVKKALLEIAPLAEEQKRRLAVEQRHIRARHDMSGMSSINVEMPTEDAVTLLAAIEAQAQQWATRPGETRTLEQLRVDALAAMRPGPDQAGKSIAVSVCVALSTLTGLDDQPAELAVDLPTSLGGGVVPIGAEHARLIAFATDSTWRRLITDPVGQLLDYGRTTYRPPAALARFVRARDRICTFANCTRPARRCDIDHRHAWEHGGQTSEHNCDCLCERHHYLKHNTIWNLTKQPDGTRRWTSPTARRYDRPPQTYPVDHTSDDPLFRNLQAPADHDRQAPEDPPPF